MTEQNDFMKAYSGELKPCPFCGGLRLDLNRNRDAFSVYCTQCGGQGKTLHHTAYAVESWNTRAPDTTRRDTLLEVISMLKKLHVSYSELSKSGFQEGYLYCLKYIIDKLERMAEEQK